MGYVMDHQSIGGRTGYGHSLGRLSALVLMLGFGAGCAGGLSEELAPPSEHFSQKAQRQQTKAMPDGSTFDETHCAYDPYDAFEPRTRFVRGPWIGECHDTQKRRPAIHLTKDEAEQFQESEGYYAIANVYHEGAFWYAFVPEGALKHVVFQLEYFPAVIPAGHTQLRLVYDTPVHLYGQSTWVQNEYRETQNLVFSVEAVTRRGDQYDLVRGAQEHFAIAFRVTTLEARYQSMVTEQDHHIEQWALEMTEAERRELLPFYVAESESSGLNYAYHTLFKNCTTDIIRILDGVVQYTWGERVKRFLVKVTEIYPNIVRAALIARGLLPLDQSTDWAPLEDDPTFRIQADY